MIWSLIKLIILAFLVTAGVVIYEEIESNEPYMSQGSSGYESTAAARPDPNQYKTHSNPDIGGGYSQDTYHNFNCSDLSMLKDRMNRAYSGYLNSGKSWDYKSYTKAKRDLDALKQQCY